MNARLLLTVIAMAAAARIARAQQTPPPVHPLGPIVAKTKEPLAGLDGIHVLSNGRVVVNDEAGGRVLLFDSTLTTFSVLLDTTGATARTYPMGPGPVVPMPKGTLIPFVGDSSVFYDPAAVALVVFAPNGRIVRVMAPPFPPDAGYLLRERDHYAPQFDGLGRAVYQAGNPSAARPSPMGEYQRGSIPADSSPIVRATAGRALPETLAYVRVPKTLAREPFITKEGVTVQRPVRDPFLVIDDWTMLPDGTIAIIRGQDYHIDWIAPSGQRSSSAKLPFQWHRLSDSEKAVVIDSVKKFYEANPGSYGNVVTQDGRRVSGTFPQGVIPLDSLADYRPPFDRYPILADADGNVWLLPTPEVPLSPSPGPVYDVVSRAGKLIDRVQLTPGFGIVGFSPGYVFMTIREEATTVLVKAKIR